MHLQVKQFDLASSHQLKKIIDGQCHTHTSTSLIASPCGNHKRYTKIKRLTNVQDTYGHYNYVGKAILLTVKYLLATIKPNPIIHETPHQLYLINNKCTCKHRRLSPLSSQLAELVTLQSESDRQ